MLKTHLELVPLISDPGDFQHSHRAASPVLCGFYSVPEAVLAQLPLTVVVYTCETQSKIC